MGKIYRRANRQKSGFLDQNWHGERGLHTASIICGQRGQIHKAILCQNVSQVLSQNNR